MYADRVESEDREPDAVEGTPAKRPMFASGRAMNVGLLRSVGHLARDNATGECGIPRRK